jgi:membrane-bound ClpP family serine protease
MTSETIEFLAWLIAIGVMLGLAFWLGRASQSQPMRVVPGGTYVIKVDTPVTQADADDIKRRFEGATRAKAVVIGEGLNIVRQRGCAS